MIAITQNSMPYRTFPLIIMLASSVVILLTLALVLLSVSRFNLLNDSWLEDIARASAIGSATDGLSRQIGYGGLIHNFKNLVLRRDLKRYEVPIEENITHIKIHLNELDNLLTADEDKKAVALIRGVFEDYERNFKKVRLMVIAGHPPQEIDRGVFVNDAPALHAIKNLMNRSRLQKLETESLKEEAQAEFNRIGITGAALLLTIIATLAFFLFERKQAIKILADINEKFSAILESAPTGIIKVDDQRKIILINQKILEMTGYSQNELIGQPIETLLPVRFRDGHTKKVRGFFSRPTDRVKGYGKHFSVLRRDGTEFPVEINLKYLNTTAGRFAIATIMDITIRMNAELKLQRASNGMKEFVYVASHDLRSPLSGISDLAEWVTEDLGEVINPKVKRNLDRIALRVKRMDQLISDLLAYSRAGAVDTNHTSFNPRKLIDQINEMQPPPAGFTIKNEAPDIEIYTAKTPIETVVRNLISNAINHHDRDTGIISIKGRMLGSEIELSVTDDGPGIPERANERIYQLFQTATTSTKKGNGIGLAMCKQYVEAHGGQISHESLDGQRGTVFRFTWPINSPKRTTPDEHTKNSAAHRAD